MLMGKKERLDKINKLNIPEEDKQIMREGLDSLGDNVDEKLRKNKEKF